MEIDNYISMLQDIKAVIIRSRYHLAKMANKEMLNLYFKVGAKISEKVAEEKWGSNTLEKLSDDLQREMNGLRGFSATNLKRMRQVYESYSSLIYYIDGTYRISPLLTDELQNGFSPISPLSTDQFTEYFFQLSFTAHYEIITKCKNLNQRVFYILKAVSEIWTVDMLKHQMNGNLFENQASLPTNFDKVLTESQQQKAIRTFRDNYLLDFVRIDDADSDNERVLEKEIVRNIKQFILSLGTDFAFIGNQYRLIVDDEEYYIDLLFFNRALQALVAFELKAGKFKPEYLGKMNFYLSALDEYIKKEYENPSIGIILCKEKNNKTVEFAFRDFNKAMGVATYQTTTTLPEKYKNVLPSAEALKQLLDANLIRT